MAIPAFDPKELTITEESPGFFPGAPTVPVYSFPVTRKEAVIALYNREPIWQITGTAMEQKILQPKGNPDASARGGPGRAAEEGQNFDMFGVEWEYVPIVGASMVRPGKPMLADANEWYDKLVWPDVNTWDLAGPAAEINKDVTKDASYICFLACGWFERLISLMDFEAALVAMIDEDQTDAVKALFFKLSELWIKVIEKYFELYPQIDVICIHDDWGSQRETFFSPAIVSDIIVPAMRMVTDYVHSKGKFCDLHSCGLLHKQIPNMIAAGWDSWSPQLVINDCKLLHDLYGDKIIIGAFHPEFDPATTSEEDQRAIARQYADTFCDPKKPSMLNFYNGMRLERAFREELYIRSRENYRK